MLVSIIAVFGGIIAHDIKINHKIDGIVKENWEWRDSWTDKNQPTQIEPKQEIVDEKPEVKEVKEQIVASSYDDAVNKSKQYGMPILIIFKAHWCHWCVKMEQETLVDSKVKTAMMNFVYLEVDTDRDSATTRKFGISGLPAYVISNADGKKIKDSNGYQNAKKFCAWLEK